MAKLLKLSLSVLLILTFMGINAQDNAVSSSEQAADQPEASQSQDGVKMGASVGSVTMNGEQWTRISLRPDIPIWKFGICLDIELFVNEKGQIDKTGWEFDNATQIINTLQRKIYYIRFGHPGETVFAKVGSIEDVTLGYGLLMYNYTNAIQYPEIKKLGLQFELNNIFPVKAGVQFMINNFQDFQNDGALLGGRLNFAPMGMADIPIVSNIQIGATFITDMNQYGGLLDSDDDKYPDLVDDFPKDKDRYVDSDGDGNADADDIDDDNDNILDADYFTTHGLTGPDSIIDNDVERRNVLKYGDIKNPVSALGFDLGIPVVQTKVLGVTVYGQYAQMLDKTDDHDSTDIQGFGISAPGVGVKFGPLSLNLEYRYFKDQFMSEYFNSTYEIDRAFKNSDGSLATKEEQLTARDSTTRSGVFGRAEFDLFSLIKAGASYQYLTVTDDRANSTAPESDQSFEAEARLGQKIMDILKRAKIADIYGYYYKRNIGTVPVGMENGDIVYDSFFDNTPNTIFGYKFGIQLSDNMVLYWDNQYTYVAKDNEPYKFELEKRVNIETAMQF